MTIRSDSGSATIWALVMVTLLGLVAIAALVVSAGLVAHRKAAAAADLAALAGATASMSDETLACATAERVAAANGASVKSCAMNDQSLLVYVVVDPESPWLPPMLVPARAGYPSTPNRSSARTSSAPALESGSFPFPHLGD